MRTGAAIGTTGRLSTYRQADSRISGQNKIGGNLTCASPAFSSPPITRRKLKLIGILERIEEHLR